MSEKELEKRVGDMELLCSKKDDEISRLKAENL